MRYVFIELLLRRIITDMPMNSALIRMTLEAEEVKKRMVMVLVHHSELLVRHKCADKNMKKKADAILFRRIAQNRKRKASWWGVGDLS